MGGISQSVHLLVRSLLLAFVGTIVFLLGLLEEVERWGLNQQFRLRGPLAPQSPLVIVSIDEDSFDELNLPWPWPRALHARFLDLVSRGRPAVVGLDIVFAEPSARGLKDDRALGQAVERAGNVILGAALTVVQEALYTKEDLNPPIAPIRERAAGYGPVNFIVDDDAFIRWASPSLRYQGENLPSFSFQVYRAALKAGIPTKPFEGSRFLINYRGGPKTFPTIPYYRVLNGEVPPETFTGKIVLVGSTSPVLHDLFPTPFAPQGEMPGVEIHANMLETLLQGVQLKRIPRPVMVFFILGAALFAVWAANRIRPLAALTTVSLVAITYAAIGFVAFVWGLLWVDVAPVSITLVLGYGGTVLENFIRVQREKRRLARFFSPAVLEEIVRHRNDQALGTARKRITVLFSDIRGFTSISEKLSPEQVVEILGEYLTKLTEVVFRHGGTVDKYVGDCIMALYNVPFEDAEHAAKAVHTALDFQKCTRELSARWEAKLGVAIKNGVGINTGEAVVGTMGSQQRLEYTAIGDTVNLAARLESITKDFKSPIIISESTYNEIRSHFRTRCLGEVTVKGKEIPVKIYAVTEAAEADVRKAVRVAVKATVTLIDGELTIQGALGDMSVSGIAVSHLPKAIDVGTIVQLRVDLPSIAGPIEATGKAIWSREDEAGFRFLYIDPRALGALGEFVARQDPLSAASDPTAR